MTAPFISFEGGEGCGKSTQIKKLEKYLLACKKDVFVTREPGGTPGGEELRDLLLNGSPDKWHPWAELLLNNASRQDHVMRKIAPMCAQGTWVISDRYADSSRVYQGLVGGVPLDDVDQLQFKMLKLPRPDLTFLLDIPFEKGLERVEKRHVEIEKTDLKKEDRYENKGLDFHKKVRTAFLYLASLEPERFVILDAEQKEEELAAQIKEVVYKRYLQEK